MHLKDCYITAAALFILTLACICRAAPPSGDQVERLRLEIRELEARIEQAETGRRGVIQQLEDIDRQIELRRRLVKELKRKESSGSVRLEKLKRNIRKLQNQIEALSNKLAEDEADLAEMRRQVGERISYMYRRLNGDRLLLLLSATDVNDLSRRQHYLHAVERYDRTRLKQLRDQRDRVITDRLERKELRRKMTIEKARQLSELEQVRTLIASRRAEERELAAERSRKSRLLDRISGDTELLRALIEERRHSLEEIEREIDRLEGRSHPSMPVWQPDLPFNKLAGKLPWPLRKRNVVHPFGRIVHPRLGTTTINPGIDIAASVGDPVYAVARGQITRIAWLRGFGNTVILSHGDGYYTVYARLGNILISEGEVVGPGQPVGEVGDTGMESSFHFEIWAKRKKQDPIKWLER